jgi:transcriptional regulator with GAF, ATPase, and Fis domain
VSSHLIAVRGAFRGMSFPLPQGDVSIGRAATNDICLEDVLVSRRHCAVRTSAGQCTIVDLGSQNGTFVNSLPVTEQRLKPGDHVEIGGSVFLFSLDKELPTNAMAKPEQFLVTATGRRSCDYPELPLPVLLKVTSMMDCLRALYAAIHDRDQQTYKRFLLVFVFDLVPADRGAIIFHPREVRETETVLGLDRRSGQIQNIYIEPGLTNRVMNEGIPMLVLSPNSGAVLCVPLANGQNVMGMIYLERMSGTFGEEDLQVMVSIARIAAVALENAQQLEWLEWQNRHLEDTVELQHSLLGKSARMNEVYDFIARVAPTDATVLISGASGTGKELVAHALHANSRRNARPFVALNCAAMPEALVESELFGYERGAFTGAVTQKKGILEIADRGTIFLDEIGELSLSQQAKLLRAVEEHEFLRLGAGHPTQVDVRVIAATNRNLQDAVNNGTFRNDLYFRINVVSITLPPLRERREDIPLLASFYLQQFSSKYNAGIKGIARTAQSALIRYDWPGNVRELQNAIERAVVLSTSDLIQPEDLSESILEGQTGEKDLADYHAAVREKKKELITHALKTARGSYTEAAKVLGVHPNYLHRLVNNFGLRAHVRDKIA